MWGQNIKGKVKHLLWCAYHYIPPTGHQLQQKGMEVDAICQGCGEEPEILEHMFFHCNKAQTIWRLSPVNWEGIQKLS